jgi:hypothetical protein
MNKTLIALALIIIAVASVLIASFTFLALSKSPEQESLPTPTTSTTISPSVPSATPSQGNNSASASPSQTSPAQPASQSTTPASSNASTPTQTSSSTGTPEYASDSAYPEGTRAWLPYGSFGMFSPANQTYTTNNLILNVTGGAISGDAYVPVLSYSLDGGQRVPVPITLTKPEGLGLTFQRVKSGSVVLPPLSNGSHVVVLYGDLGFDSRRGKITVYFEVQAE